MTTPEDRERNLAAALAQITNSWGKPYVVIVSHPDQSIPYAFGPFALKVYADTVAEMVQSEDLTDSVTAVGITGKDEDRALRSVVVLRLQPLPPEWTP